MFLCLRVCVWFVCGYGHEHHHRRRRPSPPPPQPNINTHTPNPPYNPYLRRARPPRTSSPAGPGSLRHNPGACPGSRQHRYDHQYYRHHRGGGRSPRRCGTWRGWPTPSPKRQPPHRRLCSYYGPPMLVLLLPMVAMVRRGRCCSRPPRRRAGPAPPAAPPPACVLFFSTHQIGLGKRRPPATISQPIPTKKQTTKTHLPPQLRLVLGGHIPQDTAHIQPLLRPRG